MSVEHLLEQELEQELEELSKMDFGSDEYKATVDGVSKLMDRLNDSKKIELDIQEKAAAREQDAEIKMEQIKQEKRGRMHETMTTVAGIVIPVAVTIWGTITTLKFEETGTITTTSGKNFVNKLFKK